MLWVVCIAINLYGPIPAQTLGLQVEPGPTLLHSNQILTQMRYFGSALQSQVFHKETRF